MDAMVTARVPVEIKKQGDAKLKEIGSSVTELVNEAYRFVIEEGTLPGRQQIRKSSSPIRKVLQGEEARKLRESQTSRRVLDLPEYDGTNFKELLNEARDERYARFA